MANRREALLLVCSVLVTLAGVLALLRWLAPGLLGVPTDLTLVQSSRQVPPFYRNVFRAGDRRTAEFLLNDPELLTRTRPLFPDVGEIGPNDVLGFRNRAVPAVADVVAIGDSQTYGNNAIVEQTWPAALQAAIGRNDIRVYNMASAGWGSLQYLEMFKYALYLQPKVVVVALYTGNDPLTDFTGAYGNPRWERFRVDDTLSPGDAPGVAFPSKPEDYWTATLVGGGQATFTPAYRLAANHRDDPVVRAGYEIMARTAAEMAELAALAGVTLVFGIIPTKEWVYAEYVEGEAAPAYARLVADESRNIAGLAARLAALDGVRYVDLAAALRDRVEDAGLYASSADGHPLAAGYAVIADALVDDVAAALPPALRGVVGIDKGEDNRITVYLVGPRGRYLVPAPELARDNGWPLTVTTVTPRELANVPTLGVVEGVDPDRYGPVALGISP